MPPLSLTDTAHTQISSRARLGWALDASLRTGTGFAAALVTVGIVAAWLGTYVAGGTKSVLPQLFYRELFEAARVDGAGPVRVLLGIVIPLSRPILAVIALLVAVGSWKEFLWPLIVLPNPSLQPVSVALTQISATADLSAQMASLFIALIFPVVLFLVFQRQFLRGIALSGGVKE